MNALVKNKLEIFNLLKHVQKSKQLIALSFDSLPQYCLTTLLDVHHDAEILIFDEPNPKLTNKLIETKKNSKSTVFLLINLLLEKLFQNASRPS